MMVIGGSVVGLDLRPGQLRAIRLNGWRRERVTLATATWSADDEESIVRAIATIAEGLGAATRIAVAIDLTLLMTKRAKLPPVPASAKRSIVEVEPDRFFPVRGGEDLVIDARDEDGVLFAVREIEMTRWLSAIERLGPIERVEPAPPALARALARVGIVDTVLVADRFPQGVGVLDIADGRLRGVRRIRVELADAREALTSVLRQRSATTAALHVEPWDADRVGAVRAAMPDAEPRAVPALRDVPPDYLAAYGAAIGIDATDTTGLMSGEVEQRAVARRRRSVALAAGAVVGALSFALVAADAGRAWADRRLDDRLDALRARAVEISALEQEVETLTREAAGIVALEQSRANVLDVLALLTRLLPADSHLRSVRWSGGTEWQLDGRSRNAARLIPLFEAHPRLEGVRFLEATHRVTSRGQTYESFSLAFRLVPAA